MRTVVFSTRSKIQLERLLAYLEVNFSVIIRDKFISKLDDYIAIIQKSPDSFPSSTVNNKIRKCVVSKQTILFYKFNDKEIRLLDFFDTRQNLNKIKKIK